MELEKLLVQKHLEVARSSANSVIWRDLSIQFMKRKWSFHKEQKGASDKRFFTFVDYFTNFHRQWPRCPNMLAQHSVATFLTLPHTHSLTPNQRKSRQSCCKQQRNPRKHQNLQVPLKENHTSQTHTRAHSRQTINGVRKEKIIGEELQNITRK